MIHLSVIHRLVSVRLALGLVPFMTLGTRILARKHVLSMIHGQADLNELLGQILDPHGLSHNRSFVAITAILAGQMRCLEHAGYHGAPGIDMGHEIHGSVQKTLPTGPQRAFRPASEMTGSARDELMGEAPFLSLEPLFHPLDKFCFLPVTGHT
jgi:hypothetical protein